MNSLRKASRYCCRIALGLGVASALLLTGGCHEDAMVANLQTDNAFIRMPADLDSGRTHPAAGDPFPLHAGNQWTLRVSGPDRPGTEQVTDLGPATVGDQTGEALEVRDDRGNPPRHEIYINNGGIVLLLGSGLEGQMMQMSPSIPLFHLPIKEGDAIPWDGILHFKSMSSSATALSRVSGAVTLQTPAGKFDAYRVDTMITTTVGGQAAAFPMTRWIAPGIGVVQERVLVGKVSVTKQLQSYHIKGKN